MLKCKLIVEVKIMYSIKKKLIVFIAMYKIRYSMYLLCNDAHRSIIVQ